MFITALTLFLGLGVFGALYAQFSPQLGGEVREHDSENFRDGKFRNIQPAPMSTGDKSMLVAMYEFFFKKHPDAYPKKVIETEKVNREMFDALTHGEVAVTWLGHSTALVSTSETTIIIDPVLGKKSIPPLYLGPKPFQYSNRYPVESLPTIDVVLISHDHYDHLDMETVKQLTHAQFYVPLGVKAHLVRWGIPEGNIREFDWYEGTAHSESVSFDYAPSQHFSGRGFTTGQSTLWGSWVLTLGEQKLYFSGDSGYFDGFKTIGEKYGPFDLAFLEAGQYDEAWQGVHMLPEQSIQAALDLKARAMLPIHNSKFVLAKHAWYEPLERVTAGARERGVTTATPKVGQTFLLKDALPDTRWWSE